MKRRHDRQPAPISPYVIEDGVVPWKRREREPGPLRATLIRLRVGQSFQLPIEQAKRVRRAMDRVRRDTKRLFFTRTKGEWIRVWRKL